MKLGRVNPWVKLTRTLTLPHGTESAGAVGICVGPAKTLDKDEQIVEIPGYSEIHLVHASGGIGQVVRVVDGAAVTRRVPYRGGDTRQIVAVRDEDYALVTDRNDVPADRLATYDPDWQPKARPVETEPSAG